MPVLVTYKDEDLMKIEHAVLAGDPILLIKGQWEVLVAMAITILTSSAPKPDAAFQYPMDTSQTTNEISSSSANWSQRYSWLKSVDDRQMKETGYTISSLFEPSAQMS